MQQCCRQATSIGFAFHLRKEDYCWMPQPITSISSSVEEARYLKQTTFPLVQSLTPPTWKPQWLGQTILNADLPFQTFASLSWQIYLRTTRQTKEPLVEEKNLEKTFSCWWKNTYHQATCVSDLFLWWPLHQEWHFRSKRTVPELLHRMNMFDFQRYFVCDLLAVCGGSPVLISE